MTPIANPISLIEGETSLPFADCEPTAEVCACDEAQALRAELAVMKAQRDYLAQFADPKELRQMEVELAAENAPPVAASPRCDHKFIDSLRCLKCGWDPESGAPA